MKRITFARLAVPMLAVACLALLAGCGGDDEGGLSAADMARIEAAEGAAASAQTEAEAAHMEAESAQEAADAAATDLAAAQEELADLQTQLAEAETDAGDAAAEEDTSALDDAIAALQMQIAALIEKTADPETPLAILGGEKSAMSANDRAALAAKIVGQLNAMYDHDKDKSLFNLPEIMETSDNRIVGATNVRVKDALTRNVSHAAAGDKIMSADGSSADGGFLMHSFTGGPTVDLTSAGDIATLRVGNLLEVNGVDLKSFTLKETDKVRTQTAAAIVAATATLPALAVGNTRTTTLGADGSMTVVDKNDAGDVLLDQTTTYLGGNKIVEYGLHGTPTPGRAVITLDPGTVGVGTAATATRKDGAPLTVLQVRAADGSLGTTGLETTAGATGATDYNYDPANPSWGAADPTMLVAGQLANAKAAYASAGAAYITAQHNAKGYGAWLADSFFVAYVMNAEDDLIISDPDSTVMKVAWGGRAHDSTPASNLSGRGESAMWKGLMVGHDMDADAATSGAMLKGNAMITARVGEATLADNQAARTPDIVDVSLTNIITADGTAVSRVADGIHWTNLDLSGGGFAKGTEIMGTFYDNGNEVVGEFSKSDILGVFGAAEYEMMDDAMASN